MVIYVLERFLARLEVSAYGDRFVLKGGTLLAAWDARRATVDADFLARNLNLDEESVLRRVVDIAVLPAPVEDGVEFRTDTAKGERHPRRRPLRRGSDRYGCDRCRSRREVASRHQHRRPGCPAADDRRLPNPARGHPRLRVLGYPLPVVLAEKLCTAVELGAGNSRVRDYADIWTLTRSHDLTAADLLTALAATSKHRDVTLRPLAEVIDDVIAFADPALASEVASHAIWTALGASWSG